MNLDNNSQNKLINLVNKRTCFLKIVFIIGYIITGFMFVFGLLVGERNYEYLFGFIIFFIAFLFSRNKIKNIEEENIDNNVKQSEDYIDFLHTEININRENTFLENSKATLIISVIFTIILFFVFAVILTNSKFSSFIQNIDISALIIVSLLLPLFIKYYYKFTIKEKGRTQFRINLKGNKEEEEQKIKNLLRNLCYKEINYKNERVYFAYKTKSQILAVSSIKRYITYEIKEDFIEINCWFLGFGTEFPLLLKNKSFGIENRKALINDIKFIKDNLTKVEMI